MRRASRAAVAFGIAAVVSSVAVAAGGALATDSDGGADALFFVPGVAPGDEGKYTSGEHELRFRFAAEPWVTPQGIPQQALVLWQERTDPWDSAVHGAFPLKLWLVDGQVVAWMALDQSGGGFLAASLGPRGEHGLEGAYNRYETAYRGGAAPLCGLVHSLQGTSASKGSALLALGCPAALRFMGAAAVLAPGLNDSMDGAAFAGPGVRIMLDPHFPLPTSIAVEGRVWNLAAFTRTGDDALSSAQGPPHEIVYANSTLPDEAGVEHPFPLSLAVQDARDASQPNVLQEFLRAAPDAYIAEAGFLEAIQDGRRESRWTVTASNGPDAVSVRISRFGPQADASPRPDLGFPVLPTAPVSVVEEATRPAREFPAPSGAPRLATLASLAARWDAVASNSSREQGWNAWGFAVLCGATCDQPTTQTWLGIEQTREYHTPGSVGTLGFYVIPVQETLTVDDQGTSLLRTHTDWWVAERAGPLVIVENSPQPEPAMQVAAPAAPSGWQFPGAEAAAGLTFIGILAGIGYYLWPGLKSGLLAILRTAPPPPENPIRLVLRQAIEAAPGVHFQELRRRTGKAGGTLRHHLRVLESRGEILAQDQGGYKCYFMARGTDRHLTASAGALKAPSARRMLHGILEAGILSMGDAAVYAGLTPSTATHHALRLEEAGLVTRSKAGRRIELRPTSLATMALDAAAPASES